MKKRWHFVSESDMIPIESMNDDRMANHVLTTIDLISSRWEGNRNSCLGSRNPIISHFVTIFKSILKINRIMEKSWNFVNESEIIPVEGMHDARLANYVWIEIAWNVCEWEGLLLFVLSRQSPLIDVGHLKS